jgi:hypothetical protein
MKKRPRQDSRQRREVTDGQLAGATGGLVTETTIPATKQMQETQMSFD